MGQNFFPVRCRCYGLGFFLSTFKTRVWAGVLLLSVKVKRNNTSVSQQSVPSIVYTATCKQFSQCIIVSICTQFAKQILCRWFMTILGVFIWRLVNLILILLICTGVKNILNVGFTQSCIHRCVLALHTRCFPELYEQNHRHVTRGNSLKPGSYFLRMKMRYVTNSQRIIRSSSTLPNSLANIDAKGGL